MIRLDPGTTMLAGDWHGNTPWAVAAIRRARLDGARTIIHLGDFAFRFEPAYINALHRVLKAEGVDLLFVRGNHDDTRHLARLPRNEDGTGFVTRQITHLPDGFRLRIGEETALVLGGAGSIDRASRTPDLEWWEDERIAPETITRAIQAGPADIVLAHDAPSGVDLGLDERAGRWFEKRDRGVLAWCERHRDRLAYAVDALQPRLVVHGHHHKRIRRTLPGTLRNTVTVGLDCDGTSMESNLCAFGELDEVVLASAGDDGRSIGNTAGHEDTGEHTVRRDGRRKRAGDHRDRGGEGRDRGGEGRPRGWGAAWRGTSRTRSAVMGKSVSRTEKSVPLPR